MEKKNKIKGTDCASALSSCHPKQGNNNNKTKTGRCTCKTIHRKFGRTCGKNLAATVHFLLKWNPQKEKIIAKDVVDLINVKRHLFSYHVNVKSPESGQVSRFCPTPTRITGSGCI